MAITIQYPALAYRYEGRVLRTGMTSSRTIVTTYDRAHDGTVILADTPDAMMRLDAILEDAFKAKCGDAAFFHAAAWLNDTEILSCARRASCPIIPPP